MNKASHFPPGSGLPKAAFWYFPFVTYFGNTNRSARTLKLLWLILPLEYIVALQIGAIDNDQIWIILQATAVKVITLFFACGFFFLVQEVVSDIVSILKNANASLQEVKPPKREFHQRVLKKTRVLCAVLCFTWLITYASLAVSNGISCYLATVTSSFGDCNRDLVNEFFSRFYIWSYLQWVGSFPHYLSLVLLCFINGFFGFVILIAVKYKTYYSFDYSGALSDRFLWWPLLLLATSFFHMLFESNLLR